MAKNVKIETPANKPLFMVCPRCGTKLSGNQFYTWKGKPGEVLPLCKECLYAYCIKADGLSRQGVIDASRYLDLPYVENHFQSTIEGKGTDKWKLAQYFNKLRADLNMRDSHFKDSIFEYMKEYNKVEEEVIDLRETFTPKEDNEEERLTSERVSKTERFKELQSKWGKFTSVDYMERCEELYQEIVQGGYIIRSAMHDISVRNYCKLQVDWDIAQEAKDYNAMKELKQPLRDARTDAKLNPSQLKAEDFSTGGANSFSEISRIVAQKQGFIPLPMRYYKQPNDALDFLMWELINYMRHCISLPEVEYEEIFKFYTDKINEFNEKYDADIENNDFGNLDEETKGRRREWRMI